MWTLTPLLLLLSVLTPGLTGDAEDTCRVEVTCPGGGSSQTTVQPPKGTESSKVHGSYVKRDDVRSAFMVALNDRYSPSSFRSNSKRLLYDTVVTNLGNHYNSNTGVYTVPVNGTYTFTLEFAAPDMKEAAGRLVVDETSMGKVWVTSIPQWDSASGTWVLSLHEGQTVWVERIPEASYYYGNWYCSLTGSLLFQDES